MEKTLKTEGWTLLDFEGIPIAEGLPTKADAVHAMLTYDGNDYDILPDDFSGGWRLWFTVHGRNLARSMFIFSTKTDEDEARAEIFAEVAAMAGQWDGRNGFEIVTDAVRASWTDEDEDEDEAA